MIDRRSFIAGVGAGAAVAASPLGTALAQAAVRERWSKAALTAFAGRAAALGVRALVVRSGGRVILSEGAVAEPMRVASIRKSFLSALFGIAAARQPINFDAPIASVGIDDYIPLTPFERRATIRQLLQARSGIYLPTAAETPAMIAARPGRGSHQPGTFWYYNNWDFNALGEIYQRLTGLGLFTALERDITMPLGFQDLDPMKHLRWAYDGASPRFPAYNFMMSARDLARFGQMFLDRGKLQARTIVPAPWVAESTRSYSTTGRSAGLLAGYGYMWWVAGGGGPIPAGTFTAAGNGGRYIVVMPALDTVVAIQPDEKPGQPAVPLYAQPNALNQLIGSLVTSATPLA